MLKLQFIDDGVTYYDTHYAGDAADHKPVSDACRHADHGWYNTAINADGFHCSTDLP